MRFRYEICSIRLRKTYLEYTSSHVNGKVLFLVSMYFLPRLIMMRSRWFYQQGTFVHHLKMSNSGTSGEAARLPSLLTCDVRLSWPGFHMLRNGEGNRLFLPDAWNDWLPEGPKMIYKGICKTLRCSESKNGFNWTFSAFMVTKKGGKYCKKQQ